MKDAIRYSRWADPCSRTTIVKATAVGVDASGERHIYAATADVSQAALALARHDALAAAEADLEQVMLADMADASTKFGGVTWEPVSAA